MIEEIDADTLAIRLAAWKTVALDVRDRNTISAGRIPEAILIPLSQLTTSINGLPLETSLSLICETGAESSLAASILWSLGYRKLAILKGGFESYVRQGLPVTG